MTSQTNTWHWISVIMSKEQGVCEGILSGGKKHALASGKSKYVTLSLSFHFYNWLDNVSIKNQINQVSYNCTTGSTIPCFIQAPNSLNVQEFWANSLNGTITWREPVLRRWKFELIIDIKNLHSEMRQREICTTLP